MNNKTTNMRSLGQRALRWAAVACLAATAVIGRVGAAEDSGTPTPSAAVIKQLQVLRDSEVAIQKPLEGIAASADLVTASTRKYEASGSEANGKELMATLANVVASSKTACGAIAAEAKAAATASQEVARQARDGLKALQGMRTASASQLQRIAEERGRGLAAAEFFQQRGLTNDAQLTMSQRGELLTLLSALNETKMAMNFRSWGGGELERASKILEEAADRLDRNALEFSASAGSYRAFTRSFSEMEAGLADINTGYSLTTSMAACIAESSSLRKRMQDGEMAMSGLFEAVPAGTQFVRALPDEPASSGLVARFATWWAGFAKPMATLEGGIR